MELWVWRFCGIVLFPLIFVSVLITCIPAILINWHGVFMRGEVGIKTDKRVIEALRGGLLSLDFYRKEVQKKLPGISLKM